MILAIATWNGRVSPVFDVSRRLSIFTVEEGVATHKEAVALTSEYPDLRAAQLSRMAVDALICGAISRPLAGMLTAYRIQVVPFVAGKVDEVITAYLSGELSGPHLAMPGCRGRRGRFGQRGRGAGRGRGFSTQERSDDIMPQGDGTGPDGKGPRQPGGGAGQRGKRGGGQGSGQGQGQGGKRSRRDSDPGGGGAGNRQGSGGGQGKGRGQGRGQNR